MAACVNSCEGEKEVGRQVREGSPVLYHLRRLLDGEEGFLRVPSPPSFFPAATPDPSTESLSFARWFTRRGNYIFSEISGAFYSQDSRAKGRSARSARRMLVALSDPRLASLLQDRRNSWLIRSRSAEHGCCRQHAISNPFRLPFASASAAFRAAK